MIQLNTKDLAKPFIKWVGGKGQLLQQLEKQLPTDLHEEEFTYIEPFVGGGAMLFYMLQNFMNIKQVVINDINRNLTEAYRVIKQEPEGLVYRLKQIEKQYLNITTEDRRKNFYLEMRRRFNSYVKENFIDDSQRDLADFCRMLDRTKNVCWMLSNSDCSAKNPADTFKVEYRFAC